jgi:hypothetical protein
MIHKNTYFLVDKHVKENRHIYGTIELASLNDKTSTSKVSCMKSSRDMI